MKSNCTNLRFSVSLVIALLALIAGVGWFLGVWVILPEIVWRSAIIAISLLIVTHLRTAFLRRVLIKMRQNYVRMTHLEGFHSICMAVFLVFIGHFAQAQILGTVFRDFNGNGSQDTNEPLVSGVTVNAYNTANTLCGTATTSGSTAPNYSLTGCGTGAVRVEFVLPTTGVCIASGIDYSALSGSTYGTSVQFVNGNSTNVNFAVSQPSDYSTGAANTSVFIPRYAAGDPLPVGSISGAQNWLLGFNYNTTGGSSTVPVQTLNGAVIGSIWGLAYSKQAKKVFASAFLKRHVGLGTLGTGGIYLLEPTATSFNVSTFYNMDANGHHTRADGTAPAYGSGSSYSIASNSIITYLGANDPLTGQPSGLGVVGTNMERNLSTDPLIPSYDPAAFDQTGKVGLGDIDISDDGQYLFVMNLYSRRVFRLQLNDAYNPTSVVEVVSYAVPDPGCTNGTYRPFALKFHRNKLYVGVVCSAESSGGTNANLSARVYELTNPTTAGAAFNATAIVTVPDMTYNRQSSTDWEAWTNNSDQGTSPIRYSQPILSDIEVNERGDIIMGFMDRAGNQWGYNNRKFLQTTTTSVQCHSAGEILIAGIDCSTGTYTVENNGQITSSGSSFAGVHAGATATSEGIGGREFFFDNSPGDPHNEISQGALMLLKGTGEVYASAFAISPTESSDAGVIRLSTNDGTFVSGYVLYSNTGSGTPYNFGKANGLGDVEMASDASPLEIGNRVWNDTDGDGIQDAGESPIPNVAIELYASNGTTLLATTTTNTTGNWYFRATGTAGQTWVNGSGVNSAIQPNTTYIIKVGSSDWAGGAGTGDLAGLSLTLSNVGGAGQPDVRDNDAAIVSMVPQITYTTGAAGQNDHTLDMGFRLAVCALSSAGKTLETCNNNSTSSNGTDDYITFSLNPTGANLGATYTVSVNNGGTLTNLTNGLLTGISYGSAISFRLQNGSANGTLYTITVTDASGAPCTATTTVQQNSCSTCVSPALLISNGAVCQGSLINLNTLVIGNTPTGTLSFHLTQSDADAGTNALLNSVVSPVSTMTYYVRSTVSAACYSTAAITVTVGTPPVLAVTNGSVCAGGSIDLATLVTNSGGGTLGYYTSLANANAGTGALVSSTVSPTAATNYYVRSTSGSGCYTVKTVTISITAPNCTNIQVTGPN